MIEDGWRKTLLVALRRALITFIKTGLDQVLGTKTEL